MDAAAKICLPEDPTPSLAEIQASPDVGHMGAPAFSPQSPETPLRVIVSGSDAALAAVLTRMMRGDYLWAEIAYVPDDPTSAAAVCWNVPTSRDAAVALALEGSVTPAACIRTDTGDVLAGAAEIYHADGREEFVGEVVVDSKRLIYRTGEDPSASFSGQFGARLVPTMDQPGIACSAFITPVSPPAGHSRPATLSPEQLEWFASTPGLRWLTRGKHATPAVLDHTRILQGRAVQAGGSDITVKLDGVEKPRTVNRVTFYRHLRDIQAVRQP